VNAYIAAVRMDARKVANAVPVDITPNDTVLIADAVSGVWVHHVERLMGALRAAGVSERLVEEIARGG
jgi:hypothetical protein